MNYRLKGLEPLLHAVRLLPRRVAVPAARRRRAADEAVRARWRRELGVAERVRFLGYCADMRNAYFAADFLVHPTFYDPCSHVVPEAMACGLPVITTRYNGASELMHPPREGLLIDDPHDHDKLAWLPDAAARPGAAVGVFAGGPADGGAMDLRASLSADARRLQRGGRPQEGGVNRETQAAVRRRTTSPS